MMVSMTSSLHEDFIFDGSLYYKICYIECSVVTSLNSALFVTGAKEYVECCRDLVASFPFVQENLVMEVA
jgi:hypothetical protein